MAQAKQADAELAAGKYRSPLHGIPWGAKDILAVKGYKTTWGSGAYKDQILDEEASVVEMLRDAGAVLVAKLAAGELASGDHWFGGQTKNPWNVAEGSGGSSAGPGSATGAGLVGFSIGTETGGSILQPSERCGITGLRPTFGRVSRYGVMALSWTQDRVGPMCRSAEDCAVVMSVIARPDGRDMSVSDIPFNWNAQFDISKLRAGYLEDAFKETTDPVWKRNEEKTLEQIQALGVKLSAVKLPGWAVDVSSSGVEGGAYFDELIRTGRDQQMTDPRRGSRFRSSHLVPAVEYVQSQRARMMMMMKLAEATAHVDVYLTPRGLWGGTPAGLGPGITPGDAAAADQRRESVTQRHTTMANLACYPALAVPNGFTDAGTPTSITFLARPFGEAGLVALGKAYQEASGFHRMHPNLG
jgi:Asp-tRNA(Asn)/Glu-tRNA(Gln) amidotransferase A subunit family amidase